MLRDFRASRDVRRSRVAPLRLFSLRAQPSNEIRNRDASAARGLSSRETAAPMRRQNTATSTCARGARSSPERRNKSTLRDRSSVSSRRAIAARPKRNDEMRASPRDARSRRRTCGRCVARIRNTRRRRREIDAPLRTAHRSNSGPNARTVDALRPRAALRNCERRGVRPTDRHLGARNKRRPLRRRARRSIDRALRHDLAVSFNLVAMSFHWSTREPFDAHGNIVGESPRSQSRKISSASTHPPGCAFFMRSDPGHRASHCT